MLQKTFMLLVALGLICMASNASAQQDLCVRIAGGGNFAVIKSKFQLQCCPFDPSEYNSCAPLAGFEYQPTSPAEAQGLTGRVSGSACLDKDRQFTYHYTYHNVLANPAWFDGYFETGVCVFDLRDTPTLKVPATGRCRGTVLASPTPAGHAHKSFVLDAWLWRCGPYDVERTNMPQ